jgi:hypothetical protein
MMWDVHGNAADPTQFTLRPVKILYEFDGPKTFTFRDHDGELCLAHWCDEGDGLTRYIVVAFSNRLTARLEQGAISLRDALEQPRAWVIDEDGQGVVRSAWRVDVAELPEQVLPRPGTLLQPSLEAAGRAIPSKSA